MWNIKRNRQSLEHGRKLVGNSLQQLSPVSTNVSAVSIGAHSSTSWEVGQRTSALPSPEVSLTQRDLAAWRYQLNGTTIHRQIPLARFVEYWHTRQRDPFCSSSCYRKKEKWRLDEENEEGLLLCQQGQMLPKKIDEGENFSKTSDIKARERERERESLHFHRKKKYRTPIHTLSCL